MGHGLTYGAADRPVFAIIGWKLQGGAMHGRVRVLASRTLSAAELEVRRDHDWSDFTAGARRMYTSNTVVVTVEARDFIMIEGGSWREIMEALYRKWGSV